MIAATILMLALVQDVPQAAPTAGAPLRETDRAAWPEPIEDRQPDLDARNSTEARNAIRGYGACVANTSPEKSADALSMDFTSTRYRNAMKVLSANNNGCFGRRGRMRSGNLLFAGAVAERLLARDPASLNVRLARAAAYETPSFSYTDRIAVCTVRSAPDEVAALFATPVASAEETKAARSLTMVIARCNQGGRPLSTNLAGLRAMIATAAFRSIHTGAKPAKAN
jgi:hypothetical protein